MRPLVRSLQVLGLALLVALGAGAVGSAESSSLRQAVYPTPTATGTATASPTVAPTRTPTATPTAGPGGAPQLRLSLVKKGATRTKGVKAKVRFDRQGRVTLRATKGKQRLSKKTVTFARAARKTVRLKLRKLGRVPATVLVRAQGRDASGARSKLVRKKVKITR